MCSPSPDIYSCTFTYTLTIFIDLNAYMSAACTTHACRLRLHILLGAYFLSNSFLKRQNIVYLPTPYAPPCIYSRSVNIGAVSVMHATSTRVSKKELERSHLPFPGILAASRYALFALHVGVHVAYSTNCGGTCFRPLHNTHAATCAAQSTMHVNFFFAQLRISNGFQPSRNTQQHVLHNPPCMTFKMYCISIAHITCIAHAMHTVKRPWQVQTRIAIWGRIPECAQLRHSQSTSASLRQCLHLVVALARPANPLLYM